MKKTQIAKTKTALFIIAFSIVGVCTLHNSNLVAATSPKANCWKRPGNICMIVPIWGEISGVLVLDLR
ncbi:MAG: hypothetical protein RL045_1721 [Bacteroidota bacterium]|jgi:hypothetical protein